MAAFTSKATGNWNSGGQTTWVEVGTPGSGDTWTIDAAHTITVTANVTTAGGTMNGAITVNDGVTFTITGAVTQGNANFTLGAGSGLVANTTGGSFVWTMGTANSQPNCKIVANGTSGSHATISKTGSNYFYFDDMGAGSGSNFDNTSYDLLYCDCTGITKSDGTVGFRVMTFGSSSVRCRHCVFDGCGTWRWLYDQGDVSGKFLHFSDCTWQNTPSGSQCIRMNLINASSLSDDYAWLRCAFDKTPEIAKGQKLRVKDCVFDNFLDWTGSGSGAEMTQCFVRHTSNSQEFSSPVAPTNCYWIHDQTTGNPHFLQLNTPNLGTVYGVVFEYPHALAIDPGDCVLGINVGTVTVRNCLVIPSYTDGGTSGYLCNIGSNGLGTSEVSCYHNTVAGKYARLCFVKDPGYATDEQIYDNVKSNIAYSTDGTGSNTASIVFDFDVDTTPYDVAVGSACANNNTTNGVSYTDPSNGNAVYTGYKQRFATSGTPGSNDVLGDPAFVDSTRGLATWAVYKGSASSGDSLATKLAAARTLLRGDPTLTYTDLIPWVRAGFAPTNASLRNAGHDGVTIGAVEFTSSSWTQGIEDGGIYFQAAGPRRG